ncbi:MAG: polysaccharide deacetylase family protein [Firmicutes bacterium]|nr:polysaccharide deacetylase family protein [Bacillota bacterium]
MKKLFFLMSAVLVISGCARGNEDVTEMLADETEIIQQIVQEVGDTEQQGEAPKAKHTDYYSINNSGSGWGFKKNIGAKPDISDALTVNLAQYDTYYMGSGKERFLYLTFDEGYENGYTGQILDTLKKYEVPAAFFITGAYFDREPELVRRMVDEGHIVGNHTEHHPNLHRLENPEKMKEELKILDDKYFAEYGEHMKYMRPPEGEYSMRVLAVAMDEGYKTILWSFAYRDWQRDIIMGKQYAMQQITPYLHNGAILLLHAVSKDNAEALGELIDFARADGYEFKSLDNLPRNEKVL